MKLQEAKIKAELTLCFLSPYVKRIEVVGSIRRECEEVNDIDIILIPNDNFNEVIAKLSSKITKKGDKLIIYELEGVQYDLYICTEDNWEVIKLIRTGSKEHNKMLCFMAISEGLSLKAGGEGLIRKATFMEKEKVISNTERGILERLLNKYIEPKDRI